MIPCVQVLFVTCHRHFTVIPEGTDECQQYYVRLVRHVCMHAAYFT